MIYDAAALQKAVDEIAEREDEFEKQPFLRNEIPREFIQRYLQSSDVVLDAAGGTGINALLMAPRGQHVTLVDLSPGILELAAHNIRQAGWTDKIDLVQADITDLRLFPEAHFTFVVCVGGALSHVLDQRRQAFHELVRVAQRGARLILDVDSKYGAMRHYFRYDDDVLADVLAMHETNAWSSVTDEVQSHLYTVAEFTTLVRDAGCEILEVAATPVVINSQDERKYHAEAQWAQLKALEMKLCTTSELLGIGNHLLCVARKV